MKRTALAWVICSAVALLLGYQTFARFYQEALIPEKLKTGWFYTRGECGGMFGTEGGFAVSIKPDVSAAIRREGLRYFRDVHHSRGHGGSRTFEHWVQTPVPESWWSDGVPPSLYCGSRAWLWPKAVIPALKAPGAYYNAKGHATLIVIPDQNLAVYLWRDR
ncbi:hypothetical protein GGR44_000785 [Sphingobium fontiphilum]|uniref:Uncharacterized protein n=1 Tax=Sphingobium fontiphilum TaxID=944425 RepID=A0A7W6GPM2_9SPHN|nr:hypothetical protein [Sphingobium fontiphilum]MBB3981154.1 hypothetical protein [Sphingobium fontiphilum]